jgi:hypothetical protein
MKRLVLGIYLFVMTTLSMDVMAQNTISILASDFSGLSGSSNDTSFDINNVSINLFDRTWTSLDSTDFSFGGALFFDLRNISSIDSVNLDYYHTCTGCFNITFYDSNGDSIFYNNPPQDSSYTYNESISLSYLKIWGLESGFRSLHIYTQTLNTPDLKLESPIDIYPNPFFQSITIESDLSNLLLKEKRPSKMSVHDLYGKLVYETYLAADRAHQCDLSFLTDGMYILTISTQDKLFSTKIIKQ